MPEFTLESKTQKKLTDSVDETPIFTTTEQALKDGTLKLDAKGRMPGIYLDDLEELDRRDQVKRTQALNNEASENNVLPATELNVVNSGLPPVSVSAKLVNEDAKLPADVMENL